MIRCNEPSIATGMQISASCGPEVFIGPDKLPLTDSNFFGARCAPQNVRTDGRSYFHCLPKELHIGNPERWKKALAFVVDTIIRRGHGFAGQFTTQLIQLSIFGEGSGSVVSMHGIKVVYLRFFAQWTTRSSVCQLIMH